jgi:hypothetical protein
MLATEKLRPGNRVVLNMKHVVVDLTGMQSEVNEYRGTVNAVGDDGAVKVVWDDGCMTTIQTAGLPVLHNLVES